MTADLLVFGQFQRFRGRIGHAKARKLSTLDARRHLPRPDQCVPYATSLYCSKSVVATRTRGVSPDRSKPSLPRQHRAASRLMIDN